MELVRLPNVGDHFLDRWTIEGEVGKGGFSVVFRASDPDGRVAAVKVLLPEGETKASSPAYDQDLAERFVREARLLDQLDSAYTINLWEYGESEDGLLYMVFEFIDGRMLFDEIKQNGAMDHDRVIHVMRQTLIALESAHALGILHRDIKPNNIMLYERDGDPDRVKLVDFGIAKMFDEDKALPGNDLTAAGLLVGTPRYMAPEQLKGHDLTPAADLYSLGLCAIEMLSGRKCIPGKDRVKIVERQLGPKQVVIPDDVKVDPSLEAIVHRLTAKPLHERYRNATDALRDLEALAGDPGTTGDTLYQDRPNLDELLNTPADPDDDTVYETVNSAELAAFLDQQRAKAEAAAGSVGEEPSEGAGIDPFGETMASKSSDLLTPELMAELRANDATVEARPLKRGTAPSQAYGSPEPSGFQQSFESNYGSGQFESPSMTDGPQPPTVELDKLQQQQPPANQSHGSGQFQQPPVDQSYGSGQFGQPPALQNDQSGSRQQPGADSTGPDIPFPTPGPPLPGPPPQSGAQQPYGSGQFQQPPVDQSYGSGQFGQPPDQSYGSGQFNQPPGAYGSGQFQQPPNAYGSGMHQPPGYGGSGMYQQPGYGGSGMYQQPGQGPPGYGPPGYGPPGPHGPGGPMMQGPPQLTGEDKLALAASFVVPGVGQILAGQPAKGAIMMGILLALIVFVTVWLWAPIAMLSLADTFLLVRAQKRRPVEGFEFFADWRTLL